MRSRVYAMARPARPSEERMAVQLAAAHMPPGTSARAAAAIIARRVAVAAMRDIDRDPDDFLDRSLAELAALLDTSPVATLATCPTIDTAGAIRAIRFAAFEARGGRHLPEREWPREREQTTAALAELLAHRYAHHLRKRA